MMADIQYFAEVIVAVENIFVSYVITLGILSEFKRRKISGAARCASSIN